MPPLKISPRLARLFLRRTLGFDSPFATIAAALAHHGYVQIDPINVCGRMHDLILRNRVANYREGDLMRHLHGDGSTLAPGARTAFEHHLPNSHVLVAFPLEAWAHLPATMRARAKGTGAWSGRLTPRERELARRIFAEIGARGPLSSDDIDDRRRARRAWGVSTLAKSTLQKLFFHGELLIARRDGIRRLYDLPERVLPKKLLTTPEPSAAESARWLVLTTLRQRRLALLKRQDLHLVEDRVQAVVIETPAGESVGPVLHCLREDAPLFDVLAAEISRQKSSSSLASSPLLLAPLDPLIYDRRLTKTLWDFSYTWEAYTPPHKRVRGYYALPILAGTELVGHVDSKADRIAGNLIVVSRRVRRGYAIAPVIREFARWLRVRY